MSASLVLGVASGFIMHRSDFCMVCTFRNFFLFRQTFMFRMLALLVVTSMVMFEGARRLGLLALYPFPLIGSPSLANVVGGFFFGVGMVLAGGCVVGTLYKMGGGNLLSAVAFVGLIAGSAVYAELHPWWGAFSRATTFIPGKVTIPQMLGVEPLLMIAVSAAVALYLFFGWFREGKWERSSPAEGYLQPWKAAILLAAIGLASYVIVGMPVGITTAYAKIGAYLERLIFQDHVAALSYFNATPLTYVPPFATGPVTGGAGPRFDAIAAIQFPLIFGIVSGGMVSSLMLGEFRFYYRIPARQYLSAFAGGAIMGTASRMVPGCNVWHLFGGLPIFALQSILFLLGLLPGAWLGSRLLAKWVVKSNSG